MTRAYDREDWIPWYTRDTAGWLELSLAARGTAEGIARKMGRSSDELPLGSRGLRGLAKTLSCSWEELEPTLRELFAVGPNGEPPRLIHDAERNAIRDPQATERKRPTSTSRVQKLRGSKSEPPPATTTERVETHETVSGVSVTSGDVETGSSVPSPLLYSDLLVSRSDQPDRSGGAYEEPDPAATPPDWWNGVLATLEVASEKIEDPGNAWLRYAGHRAGKRRPANAKDAVYWLSTVIIPEQKKARIVAADKRERDAKYGQLRPSGFRPPDPAPAPYHKPAAKPARPAAEPQLISVEQMRKSVGT